MKPIKKYALILFSALVLSAVGYYVYQTHVNHNLVVVAEGKFYKTSAMDPDDLIDFVEKYKIKTVIDLRMPGLEDRVLNPEEPGELELEKKALEKLPNVSYVNLPTPQVPEDHTVDKFIELLENPDVYPVLVHCYHGTGRANMFSSIYRIEFEGYSSEEARKKSRFFVPFSSFDHGTPKGEYLKAYQKRRNEKVGM